MRARIGLVGFIATAAAVAVCFLPAGRAGAALLNDSNSLLGLRFDTGGLYRISTTDASMTLVGSTVSPTTNWAALEYAPNGTLYALTSGSGGLYRLNADTGVATLIGLLNIGFVFEGGLAFSPNGTAYGVNADSADVPRLFTINLQTGAGTLVGTMTGGAHDINGLAWRGDGMLIGIDRETNALVAINPANANLSVIAPLTPTLGAAGGMAVIGGVGYFATAGSGASIAGSNELWRVDLFTGANQRIGSFAPTINGGTGIGGLAALVPEPAGIVLLAAAAAAAAASVRNRRRPR